MNYIIRKIKQEEVKLLDTFLYEAIYIPEGECRTKSLALYNKQSSDIPFFIR